MAFPINVEQFSRLHTGRSKEYNVILLTEDRGGTGVVIIRFGKAHAWGQTEVKKFSSTSDARMFFQKKCREKSARGYTIPQILDGAKKPTRDLADLQSAIGIKHIELLDRASRTALFGDDDKPITKEDEELAEKLAAAAEDDRRLAEEGERRRAEEAERKKREVEKKEAARSAALNPNWGMF